MLWKTSSFALFSAVVASSTANSVAAWKKPTSIVVDTHSSKYLYAGQSEQDARHNRRLDELITDEQEGRRTIARFTKGDPENSICWDRVSQDGFVSPIDVHNHFHPFGGPNVPYDQYMEWMIDHGIVFSVMSGLGQRIIKTNPQDPDCCYYLHCPTFNYTVTPSTTSDVLNLEWFTTGYKADYADEIKLFLSATFPNLQVPQDNIAALDDLEQRFPNAITWVGEVNLVKHALAANGFFNSPTVTEADITTVGGPLNDFFKRIEANGWPMTIHSDLGCDNYDSVPGWADRCIIEDPDSAKADADWYKDFLGMHYAAFFDEEGNAKPNFSKIQYLKLLDTIMTTFPNLKVVWAHTGLSKELTTLHPAVHGDILEAMFQRHPNLYTDMSWDIISHVWMSYDEETENIQVFKTTPHEDISADAQESFDWDQIESMRLLLNERWDRHDEKVEMFGTDEKLTGPTIDMAIILKTLHAHPDRFFTGVDFVASLGPAGDWPGLSEYKNPPTGCMKDKANHARQLTDTSAVNIMLNDTAFEKIVLGENLFRMLGLSDTFQAPKVCSSEVSDSNEETESSSAVAGDAVGGKSCLFLATLILGVLVGL